LRPLHERHNTLSDCDSLPPAPTAVGWSAVRSMEWWAGTPNPGHQSPTVARHVCTTSARRSRSRFVYGRRSRFARVTTRDRPRSHPAHRAELTSAPQSRHGRVGIALLGGAKPAGQGVAGASGEQQRREQRTRTVESLRPHGDLHGAQRRARTAMSGGGGSSARRWLMSTHVQVLGAAVRSAPMASRVSRAVTCT